MSDIVTRARELLAEITPGPWIAEYSGEQGNCVIPADAQSTREAVCVTRLYHQQADAEFIAAAPQLVADLANEVEQLQFTESSLLGELRAEVARLENLRAEHAESVKPRAIETVAQLDALPVRSVVRDADGDVHEMDDCGFWRAPRYPSILNAVVLPAHLLYLPEVDA